MSTPPPPPPPEICGYEGYSGKSKDGTPLRFYSAEECKAKGGYVGGVGECLYSKGSLSWDCRGVNDTPLGMLYENRFYIGGALVVGGILALRMRR